MQGAEIELAPIHSYVVEGMDEVLFMHPVCIHSKLVRGKQTSGNCVKINRFVFIKL